MMRKLIQLLFRRPLLFISSKLHGSPKKTDVFAKLTALLNKIENNKTDIGIKINISVDDKFVIVSDTHKGNGNDADDFKLAIPNYLAACKYYLDNDYKMVALGDIEELWENDIVSVIVANEESIAAEKEFVKKEAFYKIVGNHDLYWKSTPLVAKKWLKKMYDTAIPVYDGLILNYKNDDCAIKFFLTHGHQGDKTSDGNALSKWFVANVWSSVQAFLNININTPSKDFYLRNQHNKMMYNWSETQSNTVLITGHTHKPVFASLTHVQQLEQQLATAIAKNDAQLVEKLKKDIYIRKQDEINVEKIIPKSSSYFNTGCCCFIDGDITVIEIANGKITLRKWYKTALGNQFNSILQETEINTLKI